MKKGQLLKKLEQAWSAFNQSYADLTNEECLELGVTESWSVKDILAHVSWWEEEALKYLPHIQEGIRPPRYSLLYGGIDAFNSRMTEQRRRLTLSEVRKQLEETHLKLIEYLQSVPEELFKSETSFRRRLRLDTYSHYPIHTRDIYEWRKRSLDVTQK
jgi:hypothetical protein